MVARFVGFDIGKELALVDPYVTDGIRAQVISWVAYVVLVGAVFNAMDRGVGEAADPDRVIGSTVWVSLPVFLQTGQPVRW